MNSSVFARTAQALSSEFDDGEDDEHDSSDEREGLDMLLGHPNSAPVPLIPFWSANLPTFAIEPVYSISLWIAW